MSEGTRNLPGDAGQANGAAHNHSPVDSTNGHTSSIVNASPSPRTESSSSPSAPVPAPSSGPLFVVRSLLSLLWLRLRSLWLVSPSTKALLASIAFLWVTLDPHRRPIHLRTMLTFGPSALVNELAHLFLPFVSVPALYLLYSQLRSNSMQWKVWAALAAHAVSAVSLLSLVHKSLASRASFRYALLHPGQLTPDAQRAITSEQQQPLNAAKPSGPCLPATALLSSLSTVTPPSSTPPASTPPSIPSAAAPTAAAAQLWSADELTAIDHVGDLDVWRCVQAMLPFPVLSRWKDGIRCDSGITYHIVHGEKKVQHLKLDVYHPPQSPLSHNKTITTTTTTSTSSFSSIPASPQPLFPLVVYIHGGGWITGDKRWGSMPLITELAHQGYVVVSVNYRLAPYVRFPSFLIDIKRAIAYTKHHAAASWYGDSSRTFLAGESAGGHLATLTALTQSDMTYQPGFENVDTSCIAVCDLYGVHSFVKGKSSSSGDDRVKAEAESFYQFLHSYVLTHPIATHPALYHAASPLSVLTALLSSVAPATTSCTTLPFFFCAHGTNDTLVPIEDTWRFFDAIVQRREKEAEATAAAAAVGTGGDSIGGVMDVLVDVSGGSHAFNIVYNARSYALNDALGIWMRRVVRAVDEREQQRETDKQKLAVEVAQLREIVRAEMNKAGETKFVQAPSLNSKL